MSLPNAIPAGGESSERIDYLDGVRGVAALVVFCDHYLGFFGFPQMTPALVKKMFVSSPLHMVWDGFAAVSLFFVLSGLVLTRKYFARQERFSAERFSLAGFYLARVVRIGGPFLVVLALSWLVRHYLFEVRELPMSVSIWYRGLWQKEVDLTSFLWQAALIFRRPPEALLFQDWSLRLEMHFSFLIPFMVLLAFRGTAWLVAFCLAGLVAGVSPALLHFTLGVLLARHFQQVQSRVLAMPSLVRWFMLGVGLLLYSGRNTLVGVWFERFFEVSDFVTNPVMRLVTGCGAALILVSVLGMPELQRWLVSQPVRFLGRVSYGLYLCHVTVLLAFTPWLLQRLVAAGMPVDGAWLTGFLISLPLTLWLSEWLYRWVELPCIRLGKAVNGGKIF
ncbi:MAG: acyltransferase [Magnetococcales bacterium]|nr:acyltransferase [Magnetococcales bacterium]